MKNISVCHVATHDILGGAAVGAYRIHSGLRRIGVASQMLVGRKSSSDPDVHVAKHDLPWLWKMQRELKRVLSRAEKKKRSSASVLGVESFSDDHAIGRHQLANQLPPTDVVHIQWVAGFVDYASFFSKFRPGRPLVWTLADMNPFSGGCHYSLGCQRYEIGCGACPQLSSQNTHDLSAQIFNRKAAALSVLRPETTAIVALSNWTKNMAEKSKIFSGLPIVQIPYSLDTEIFQPRNRREARQMLGLPADDLIISFVADSVSNPRKGFDLLHSALSELNIGFPVTVVSVGKGGKQIENASYRHIPLGRIDDQILLSHAYSAADVFVSPARAEMFGQVILEAMSCGIPVVAFAIGGIVDFVRSGETGILVAPENVDFLRSALETLLMDEDLRHRMGRVGRLTAEKDHRFELQAERYKVLYESLIDASKRI